MLRTHAGQCKKSECKLMNGSARKEARSMQWSEEEFLKWVRDHPTVGDLIERTKGQPRDSEAGSGLKAGKSEKQLKRPLWNFLRSAERRR
jgi:hypothetical protein